MVRMTITSRRTPSGVEITAYLLAGQTVRTIGPTVESAATAMHEMLDLERRKIDSEFVRLAAQLRVLEGDE